MFCKNCGKEIPEDSKFCPFCGCNLQEEKVQAESAESIKPDTAESVNTGAETVNPGATGNVHMQADVNAKPAEPADDEEFKRLVNAYISHNPTGTASSSAVDYYYPAFKKLKDNMNAFTWNWAGFIFGAFNLFYRKAVAYGFLLLGGIIILSLILDAMGLQVGSVVFWCFSACVVDKFHYLRFKKKLEEAQKSFPGDIESQCKFLAAC